MNVREIFRDLSQLFFPHVCLACGTDILSVHTVLCARCIERIPVTNFHRTPGNQVERIFYGRIQVTQAGSYCYFSKGSVIQQLLHHLKYKGNMNAGIFAGRLMGESMLSSGQFSQVNALVPLPLFPSRERKRGYNQAEILCEGISDVTGIRVLRDVVSRLSASQTQTHKNRVERWQNMEGRFIVKDNTPLKDKHLLLVDDVITTGATLEACGQELLRAGPGSLSVFTLAYTGRD
jgi:ComF family protein